jgi:hypothetical protein
MLYNLL